MVTNLISKVAQILGDFLGSCDYHCFLSQTVEASFCAIFAKIWASFNFNIWSHCMQLTKRANKVPYLLLLK